jgi:hypothetical protein
VFRRDRELPALDRDTANDMISKLMEIDAKLDLLLQHFGLDDGEDESGTDA